MIFRSGLAARCGSMIAAIQDMRIGGGGFKLRLRLANDNQVEGSPNSDRRFHGKEAAASLL